MTDLSRRAALKSAGAGGLLAAAMGAGLLRPSEALADRNRSAFEAKTVGEALKSLRVTAPVETKDIAIRAPDVADNGAFVPLEIQSGIPGTQSIAVLIDKNPFPYAGSFDVSQGAMPFVTLRVKMSESSNVRVVVAAADGRFYTAVREVKVIIGGCGV